MIAIIPTLVGLCIIILGLYLIFVDPISNMKDIILSGEGADNNGSSNSYPIIGIVLVILGYLSHRLGRNYADIKMEDPGDEEPSAKEKEPDLMIDYEDN